MIQKKKIRVLIQLSKKHNEFLDEDKLYLIPKLEKDLTKYQILPEIGEVLSIDSYDEFIDYFTGKKAGPFPIGSSAVVIHRSYTPAIGAVDLNIVPRHEYEEENKTKKSSE